MNTRTASLVSSLLLVLAISPALAARPPREILGVYVGMPYEESRERLAREGEFTGGPLGPSGGKHVWKLEDERFSHVVVRYNRDHQVEWITAFAREDGSAVRYRDIGDLKKAWLQGNYFYTWNQPASGDRPASLVRASGTDPERLASLSLYRLGSAFKEVGTSAGKR
jgi:hypothetical protein